MEVGTGEHEVEGTGGTVGYDARAEDVRVVGRRRVTVLP